MAEFYYGTGRRKTSVARVKIFPGSGKITINDKDVSAYFARPVLENRVRLPLQLTSRADQFDVVADVRGGGICAQADAVKLGISRALAQADTGLVPVLKKSSCLTRDPREKERKKYGQRGARARFQYSKR